MSDCIFCKIAAKEIPSQLVYEDERVIAINDIQPAAPVHILVIPKKHSANIMEIAADDQGIAGYVMEVIPQIAAQAGLAEEGFRVVVNTKEIGGQTVPHIHWHLLGGRNMKWPPG
ncbi:MAG TPA: histidine triad nucleotide-binding protein [Patescibacteria group bacterium]|nr:histidine triad nucleotide-binding protein [Patescibacteria group bacterium]